MKTTLTLLGIALAMPSLADAALDAIARFHRYPVRYCAVTNTPQDRSNLVARLFAHDPAAETRIWPSGGVPLLTATNALRFVENELYQSNVIVTDINEPLFAFYRAKGTGLKPCVVILPGGGYAQLGWNKEGTEIAEWLNKLGFSAAILLYRCPKQRDAALADAQRTMGLLRRDAKRYGIDAGSVGVIGFSAGANLAIRLSTNWRKRVYGRIDDADDFSCRPDFQLPIYPWDIRRRNRRGGWTGFDILPEYPIDAETPPAFIVQAADDFCELETAVSYDYHLRLAGVSSVLKAYPNGGHGFGLRQLGTAADVWSDEASGWLAQYARPSRRILFLGDSITDRRHIGCTKNYWGFLADRYGFHPHVYGVNGQQMSHIPAQAARYQAEHGNEPDVVFVWAGTNDFNSSVPLGDWYGVTEEKTNRNGREVTLKRRTLLMDDSFRGRISRAIADLRGRFPHARIVMLTPIHRGAARFGATNVQPDESFANERGLFIDEYVKAVREAANVWSVTVVDINASADIYPNAAAHDSLLHNAETDRLHPSNDGHRRIADAIAREVGDLLRR